MLYTIDSDLLRNRKINRIHKFNKLSKEVQVHWLVK